MQLPCCHDAFVPPLKLLSYLLSDSHPVGRSKARFFTKHGFDRQHPDLLRDALLAIARSNEVQFTETNPHGVLYVIDGELEAPQGDVLSVRTVWIIETDSTAPRLVTAFPW